MNRLIKITTKKQHIANDPKLIDEYNQLEKTENNIELALRAVDINNQLKPVRILGFNAQAALTVSILTTAISFYSALLSLYVNSASPVATSGEAV
jgi:hypothetical protein